MSKILILNDLQNIMLVGHQLSARSARQQCAYLYHVGHYVTEYVRRPSDVSL